MLLNHRPGKVVTDSVVETVVKIEKEVVATMIERVGLERGRARVFAGAFVSSCKMDVSRFG